MITKEKNLFYITIEAKQRNYTFDLNTCTAYSGKRALKSTEAIKMNLRKGWYLNLADCENNQLLYFILNNNIVPTELHVRIVSIAERLYAIGYPINNMNFNTLCKYAEFLDKNFKTFIDAWKANPDITIIEVYEKHIIIPFLAKENIVLGADELNQYGVTSYLIGIINTNSTEAIEAIKLYSYYKRNGMIDFINKFTQHNHTFTYYCDCFKNYIKKCHELNKPIYKGNSFIKEFLNISTEYETKKNEIIAKKLKEHQTEILKYENDEYIVIVPTTPEAFKDEADQQNNCVYRNYLSEVANGHTNVVFIRKKTDITKSYITCEIYKKNITQYYLKNNTYTYNENDLNFKKEYLEYLKTVL